MMKALLFLCFIVLFCAALALPVDPVEGIMNSANPGSIIKGIPGAGAFGQL